MNINIYFNNDDGSCKRRGYNFFLLSGSAYNENDSCAQMMNCTKKVILPRKVGGSF